jgi:hypothetical protein
VTTISSPALSVRPSVRVSMKLSDVMFAPNVIPFGSQPRKRAAVSSAVSTSASVRMLVPYGPPRFAFDSRKYVDTASMTESGTCVPPGPSKKTSSLCSDENRARTASTS